MTPDILSLPFAAISGLADAIAEDDLVLASVFAVLILMGMEQAQEAARNAIRSRRERPS
jgi:hypothetical protein